MTGVHLRIFVVDDEANISSTLVAIFKLHGHEATGFSNPLAVLKAMETISPDVVLSDVIMPAMSGIELSLQMQIMHPRCKIILFSGQATTADLLADAQKHGHEFTVLAKPIHPKVLLEVIGTLNPQDNFGSPPPEKSTQAR
jgi:DNA-binding NtrC family response regulator